MSAQSRTATRGWWGERWAALLDTVPPAGARRVQRGQGLARRGAVQDLDIAPGLIRGTVVEDRAAPLAVSIAWPVAADTLWDAALAALATELRFTAALLDGRLDAAVGDALADAGVRLVPSLDELDPSCPCPERAELCRHVVALHVVAGAALDRDPAQLVRLRGRDLDAIVRELRNDPTRAPAATGIDLGRGLEAAAGDLDAIGLHPAPVEDPANLFRHLGPPPGVQDDRAIVAIIERAAATAWRLAAGDGAEAADEELLLAQLRAQRVASAAALAAALGRDVEVVRAALDALFEAGAVLRTGTGERARYRAATS